MEYILDILRQKNKEAPSYRQQIKFETEDEKATVATALTKINSMENAKDIKGDIIEPVIWDKGCLQKKCGACAMLINDTPALACDSILRDIAKDGVIKLGPLKKFPVIADLMTDRNILLENLKEMELWIGEETDPKKQDTDNAYEASGCMQCGLCLEVCPNFSPGEKFFGSAAFVPTARLLSVVSKEDKKRIKKEYKKHVYAGCGKSLACEKVCPAKINMDRILSRSNKISMWKIN